MAFADAVAALGPVAYYRLGEASGTTAVDASGNGHDGTYSGSPSLGQPSLTGDAGDKAALFSGSAAMEIPAGTWRDTDAFTWVVVFSGYDGSGFANILDRNDGYQSLWVGADQKLHSFIYTTATAGSTTPSDGTSSLFTTPLVDSGVHLAGVSFGDPNVTAWLDGVAATPGVLSGSGGMGGAFYLGATPGNGPNVAALTIDEVAVFDRVLTQGEWDTLAAEMNPGPPPVGTDLTYGNYGYGYTGETLLEWSPPAAAAPPSHPMTSPLRRVHYSLPAPTLVDGRPT